MFTCRRIISQNFPNKQRGSMDKDRLQQIEEYILGFFQRRQQSRVLAKELFDSTSEYANADLVRAFEDLEKKHRLLVRHTHDGNDNISLKPKGRSYVGWERSEVEVERHLLLHPPR